MEFLFWASLILAAIGAFFWLKWEGQFVTGAFRVLSSLSGPYVPAFDRRPAVGAMIFGAAGMALSGISIFGPAVVFWWTPELSSFLESCFRWGGPFLLIGFFIGIWSR